MVSYKSNHFLLIEKFLLSDNVISNAIYNFSQLVCIDVMPYVYSVLNVEINLIIVTITYKDLILPAVTVVWNALLYIWPGVFVPIAIYCSRLKLRVIDYLGYLTDRIFPDAVSNMATFVPRYHQLNDLLWQEGYLIDFAQKKSADKTIRKFLILSAYLFNERSLFDKLIRIYSDIIVLITSKKAIYGFNNVANALTWLVFIISILVIILTTVFLLQTHF